jgi:hypothetical protein
VDCGRWCAGRACGFLSMWCTRTQEIDSLALVEFSCPWVSYMCVSLVLARPHIVQQQQQQQQHTTVPARRRRVDKRENGNQRRHYFAAGRR